MEMENQRIFINQLTVPQEAIDVNNHVNNVVYVQWMQDVAVMHSDFVGGTEEMKEWNGGWIIRSHNVEYLAPALANDQLDVITWVSNLQKIRSLRKYLFVNRNTGKVLAKGETQWVFVDVDNGRPKAIPQSLKNRFPVVSDDELNDFVANIDR